MPLYEKLWMRDKYFFHSLKDGFRSILINAESWGKPCNLESNLMKEPLEQFLESWYLWISVFLIVNIRSTRNSFNQFRIPPKFVGYQINFKIKKMQSKSGWNRFIVFHEEWEHYPHLKRLRFEFMLNLVKLHTFIVDKEHNFNT